MDQFMEDFLIGLPTAFESQEYRVQLTTINEQIEGQQEAAFAVLDKKPTKIIALWFAHLRVIR